MTGTGWTCASCRASNASMWTYCEACGQERGGAGTKPGSPAKASRTSCDCGAGLTTQGLCERFGGYPATSTCPFTCPICRGPLDWSGGCERCHGCTSGRREDWTFPGDRYALEKGHWQRVDGPRRACTREQNAKGMAEVRAILGLDVARPTAARTASGRARLVPPVDPAVRRAVEGR